MLPEAGVQGGPAFAPLVLLGKSVTSAKQATAAETADERVFEDVKLMHIGKSGINAGQFFAALCDNLKGRLSAANTDLLSQLKVLDSASWLNDDSRVIYGEDSVVKLAKRLNLDCRQAVEQFRKLKAGRQPERQIKQVLAAAATYPGTSAECERGFSTMNEIAWDKRNSLHVETVSNLMF